MFSVLSGGEILLLDWELNGAQPVRDVKTKTVRKYPHPTDHFPALFYVTIAKKNGRNLKNTHPSTSTLPYMLAFFPLRSHDLMRQALYYLNICG